MALRGNLSDMNIGDVLQLPTMGARSGEMKVRFGNKVASLYYADGRMVHARAGSLRDEDAVVLVLGWTEGEFAFDVDVEPPERTLDEDLPRLLMRSAKKRDEEERKPKAASGKVSLNSPEVDEALQSALNAHSGFSVIAFVTHDGKELNVRPEGAESTQVAVEFARRCFVLADDAPRAEVRRCWVEDAEGHFLWLRLGGEVSLVIVAESSVSMGVLMLAATKIGANLKQAISGHEA